MDSLTMSVQIRPDSHHFMERWPSWSMAAVLKTVGVNAHAGSNPVLSSSFGVVAEWLKAAPC